MSHVDLKLSLLNQLSVLGKFEHSEGGLISVVLSGFLDWSNLLVLLIRRLVFGMGK
jgi:hypothetical protein